MRAPEILRRGVHFNLRSKGRSAVNERLVRTSLLRFGAMMALWRQSVQCSLRIICHINGRSSPTRRPLATARKWLSVVDAGNYAEAFAMLPARHPIRVVTPSEKHWVGYQRAAEETAGNSVVP